ncbi:MAG: 23S rRNA (guanosine(2251)-2'-O)-methyltransferase RlmB [Sulfuriferula sp.]|jgi:23S rRNA (guanosine2251-2'-O)-methyltransferase|nr:23S rRNA (guanosine(2251)-2'-O)-methyltransferase RlmB [Sulfuriferula sp.]
MAAILIYGFHAVTSRLRVNPASIEEIYVDAARQDPRARDLIESAKQLGLRIMQVDSKRLDGIAGGPRHQGIAARVTMVQQPRHVDEVLEGLQGPLLLLILDGVQDPHNLGACLRVADAMGANAVIAPKDRAVGLTPTVAKVACGAADTVPYLTVTNLARAMRDIKEYGVFIIGTDGEAETEIAQADVSGSVAWVLGAEGTGLRRLTREHCDTMVKIPMYGTVESLNVSVSAGICLYETRRQRS